MGHKVNILVMDTEMYSNTGGRCQKLRLRGQWLNSQLPERKMGKRSGDDGPSYGSVYVARIAMGAIRTQAIKAFRS